MTIRLSEFTKKVLNNIVDINGGVIIKKTVNNKTLVTTTSASTSIALSVELPEHFSYDVVISELRRFLNINDAFDDAELDFHSSHVVIKSDKNKAKIKYCYSDPRAVVSCQGSPETGDEIVSVDISKEQLDKIKKQSNILQLPHIQFAVEDGAVVCIAKDCDNPSSNTITYDLGEANGIEINEDVVVTAESLKVIPDDYQVTVCECAVKFNPLNNRTMTYVIARKAVY